jgi:hypothetical protein
LSNKVEPGRLGEIVGSQDARGKRLNEHVVLEIKEIFKRIIITATKI